MLQFSTLPFELRTSTLKWLHVDEKFKLLKVSRNLRLFVLNNGPFSQKIDEVSSRISTTPHPRDDRRIARLQPGPSIHHYENIKNLPYFGEVLGETERRRDGPRPQIRHGMLGIEWCSFEINIQHGSTVISIGEESQRSNHELINFFRPENPQSVERNLPKPVEIAFPSFVSSYRTIPQKKVSIFLNLIGPAKKLIITGGSLDIRESEKEQFRTHFDGGKFFKKLVHLNELEVNGRISFLCCVLENLNERLNQRCKLILAEGIFAGNFEDEKEKSDKLSKALEFDMFRNVNKCRYLRSNWAFFDALEKMNAKFVLSHRTRWTPFRELVQKLLNGESLNGNCQPITGIQLQGSPPNYEALDGLVGDLFEHSLKEIPEVLEKSINFWDCLINGYKIEELTEKELDSKRRRRVTKKFFGNHLNSREGQIMALVLVEEVLSDDTSNQNPYQPYASPPPITAVYFFRKDLTSIA